MNQLNNILGSATPGSGGGGGGGGGGGFSPAAASGASVAALALVPAGLVAIAVFPPYESPRTKPAVSVIFAEDPEVMMLNDDVTLMRTKRSLMNHMKRNLKRNYRRPSVFYGVWQFLLGKVRTTGNTIKRVKDEAMCAKTRLRVLKMKLKNYYARKKKKESKIKNSYREGNNIPRRRKRQVRRKKIMNSMDDCFSDMPEPKYGFKTKVTVVENAPCVLGSTCGVREGSRLRKRMAE